MSLTTVRPGFGRRKERPRSAALDASRRTDFWRAYAALPDGIRRRADKQFALLKANPGHASLQFKKIGERQGQEIWSARVTLS